MSNLVPTQTLDLGRAELEMERDPRLKSAHTRTGYLHDLAGFETWRAGRGLTRLLVEQYAAELQAAGRSPNTINRTLAAVRWWARRAAAHLEEIETETLSDAERAELAKLIERAGLAAAVRDVTGKRPPAGRAVTSGELEATIACCETDPTPAGARDAALVAVAYGAGLRRAELAGLRLDNIALDDTGAGVLTVRGKGDKARMITLENGALFHLLDWLERRGAEPDYLFPAIRKGGKILPGRRLSGEAMRLILGKRIERAGAKPYTWHDLRRTFAGNLLSNGVDLVTVQKLMGHASPTTTAGYDRRDAAVQRAAIKTLFVPYHGRR